MECWKERTGDPWDDWQERSGDGLEAGGTELVMIGVLVGKNGNGWYVGRAGLVVAAMQAGQDRTGDG